MKTAIIGKGWVGDSMLKLFPTSAVYSHNLVLHEGEWIKDPVAWKEDEQKYKDMVNACDIAFICVPTPNVSKDPGKEKVDGMLDISAVEEAVSWCECPILVIRSTVNPGTTDHLANKYGKRIVMQPEYLGETPAHPMYDPRTRQFLVLGGWKDDTRKLIEAYHDAYNANVTIRQVTALEAEVIKLSENRAIAFKVAECQELFDACQSAKVDYYTIRDAVYADDPRFNLWWTFVFPDKRGFNSKCIPKDIYAWAAWAESYGYDPVITRAILERNKLWISQ